MSKAAELAALIGGTSGSSLSNRNMIINGAMQVAQRGTSFTGITSTIAYRMDRWQVGFGAAGSNYAITQSTDAPDNFKYSMKWQRTASNAVTNTIWFSQAFESIDSKVVAGRTCTLSYYAKKGANYSATSSDIQVRIISGTGTDESATSAITAGWAGYAAPLSTTQVITTDWVRYTHSVTFASNVNQISVNVGSNSAGTAGADDSLQITGIQLELGEQAQPFEHEEFGSELAKCQRYYMKWLADTAYDAAFAGFTLNSTQFFGTYNFPCEMRGVPTMAVGGNWNVFITGGDYAASSFQLNQATPFNMMVYAASSGMTAGSGGLMRTNNDDDAYVEFISEL